MMQSEVQLSIESGSMNTSGVIDAGATARRVFRHSLMVSASSPAPRPGQPERRGGLLPPAWATQAGRTSGKAQQRGCGPGPVRSASQPWHCCAAKEGPG